MTGFAPARPRRPLSLRAMAFALMLALVSAQTLGLLHRTVHSDHVEAGSPAFANPVAMVDVDAGWIEALFAGHRSQRDCDAFDQWGHADAAVDAGIVPTTAVLRGEPLMLHRAWHIAAQARGFLARGPPVLA